MHRRQLRGSAAPPAPKILQIVVAAAWVLLAVAPAADAGKSRIRSCAAKGSKTIAATDRVRVYEIEVPGSDLSTSYFYACYVPTGRRFLLRGEENRKPDKFEYVDELRIAGRFVGYTFFDGSIASRSEDVRTLDVKRGKARTHAAGRIHVTDLELKSNGSVAWISNAEDAQGKLLPRTVSKSDADGTALVLDTGDDIGVDSLALSGSTLYWTKAGQPRSAMLR